MTRIALGLVLSIGLVGSLVQAGFDDEKVPVDKLPAPVVKTAMKLFPEAKIVAASKESEDGETFYEVEMTLNGKTIDLLFEPDGELETIEKQIEADDLPGAVKKAIKEKYADSTISKVEEITEEDDKVLYELTFTKAGKTTEVVFAPNGKVVEDDDKEKDDDDDKEKKEKK